MKTTTKRGTILAAAALGAAILLGQALPSQAQTLATPQAQSATATTTAWHGGGWHGGGHGMGGGCGW